VTSTIADRIPMLRLELQVFVASPGDVVAERRIVEEVIAEVARSPHINRFCSLTAGLYERVVPPIQEDSAQAAVERFMMRPQDCDVMIGLFGNRLGSPVTDGDGRLFASGTAYELLSALAAKPPPPVLLYRSRCEPTAPVDQAQLAALEEFLDRLARGQGGLRLPATEAASHAALREEVRRGLNTAVWEIIRRRVPRRLATLAALLLLFAAALWTSHWFGVNRGTARGVQSAAEAWSEVVLRHGEITDPKIEQLGCALVPALMEKLAAKISDSQAGDLVDALARVAGHGGKDCACAALFSVLDLTSPGHRYCVATHRLTVDALASQRTCGDQRSRLCDYRGKIERKESLNALCSREQTLDGLRASLEAGLGAEEARKCAGAVQ
jgi:hypothetical protein